MQRIAEPVARKTRVLVLHCFLCCRRIGVDQKCRVLPTLDELEILPCLLAVKSVGLQYPHTLVTWRPVQARRPMALPNHNVRCALLPLEVAPEQRAPKEVLVEIEEVVLLVP